MTKISDIMSGKEKCDEADWAGEVYSEWFNRDEFLNDLPNGDGKTYIKELINDLYKKRRKIRNKWTNINDDIKTELVNKLILELMKTICDDED
tara:strand:+ start:3265 stop:3543 length:279 start_codon:yes stop_codon:yes gene_type:complete